MSLFKQWIEEHADVELDQIFPNPSGLRRQKAYMILPKGDSGFTFVVRNRRFAVSQLQNKLEVQVVDEPQKKQKWTLGQNWLGEEVADQQAGSELLESNILHKIPVPSAYNQIFKWMLSGVG